MGSADSSRLGGALGGGVCSPLPAGGVAVLGETKRAGGGGHQLGGGAVALPCNPPGNARSRAGVWGTSEPPRLRTPEWGHPSLGGAASPWGPSPVSEPCMEQGGGGFGGGHTPCPGKGPWGSWGLRPSPAGSTSPVLGSCLWGSPGGVSVGRIWPCFLGAGPPGWKVGAGSGWVGTAGGCPLRPAGQLLGRAADGVGSVPGASPAQRRGFLEGPWERPRGWGALPGTRLSPLAVRWVPRRCPLLAPGGSPCCRPGSGGPAASRLTQDPLPTPQPDTGCAPGVTAALLELARTPQTLSVSLGAGTGPLEGSPQLPKYPLAPRGAVAASRGLAPGPMSRCQGLEHLALWQGPRVATALPSCHRPRPKSFSPEPNPAPCPLPSAGGSSWALSPQGDTAGGCPKKLALLSWGGSWGWAGCARQQDPAP